MGGATIRQRFLAASNGLAEPRSLADGHRPGYRATRLECGNNPLYTPLWTCAPSGCRPLAHPAQLPETGQVTQGSTTEVVALWAHPRLVAIGAPER